MVATVQAALDGIVIITLAVLLIHHHIGAITFEYLMMLMLHLAILALAYDYMGIYRSNSSYTLTAFKLFKAWVLTFLLLTFIGFASKQGEQFSRVFMAQFYTLGLASQVVLNLAFYWLHKFWFAHRSDVDNALVIGQGDLTTYLSLKVTNNPWLHQRLVGSVSLDEGVVNEELNLVGDDLPVLGAVADLGEIITSQDVRVAYIVTPLSGSRLLEKVYFTLLDNNITVHWVPDIFSLRLINHSVNEIAGIPVLTLSETPFTGTRLMLKNLEDRILSTFMLLVGAPVLMLIALAVRLDSPGPVFFRQERAGWNGRTFSIWKFRSMYAHQSEEGGLKQAQKDDSRVTRMGAILRRTSLDELPQLFNVFLGDMSLVGPRPHALKHDQEYSRRITDYFARHNIKPGITGLAQVRGFRGETREIEQMVQRVESDIEYINNWSMWLDFTILVRTTAAFAGKYAY
jgi:putative colanic acid biosynthesis UDP-glucose lipid carrier transferase